MRLQAKRTKLPSRTNRSSPDQFLGAQVNHREFAIGWCKAGCKQRRKERHGVSCVRRPSLTATNPEARAFVDLCPGNKTSQHGHVHYVDDCQVINFIHRNTAPVHTSTNTRMDQRAIEGRGRQRTLIVELLEADPTDHLVNRCDAPHIGTHQHPTVEFGHPRRKRLGG